MNRVRQTSKTQSSRSNGGVEPANQPGAQEELDAQDELGSQVDLFALTGGGRRASRATRFEFGFPS